MPIKIVDNTFTDIFGNALTFYRANAGDKIIQTVDIEANIQVTESALISFQLNWIDNEIQLLGNTTFLDEGLRLGDSILWELYNADGTLHTSTADTISYLDDYTLRLTGTFGGYFDQSAYTMRVVTTRALSDLEVNLNHVLQDGNATFNSLIDNELTIIKFVDVAGLSVAGTLNGALIGKQSGQYLISGSILRNADAFSSRQYTLTLTYIQSGAYKSEWFDFGSCLKLAIQYKFFSLPNETAHIPILKWSETADTGWFNEAYNVGVIDSTLTTGIDTLAYNLPTTTDIVINSTSSDLYIGAQYISTDPDYYKNKVDNQNDLGLLLDAYIPLAVGTYTSNGGLYTIDINSITLVVTTYTINITFTPLAGFDTLIESFEVGDRLFYIWVNAGTVNHLIFADQVYKSFSSELPLFVEGINYIRHDNLTEIATGGTVLKTNTEDDLALYCKFGMTPFVVYNGIRTTIRAINSVTLEEFDLQTAFFSFSGAPIGSNGRYLIDSYQGVTNNLQSTSPKKTAHLVADGTSNFSTIYYPFLNNWRDWLAQTNASTDFYPNQNQNWVDYISGNWTIVNELSLETDDVIYTKQFNLPISNYDTEPAITSVITYKREDATLTTSLFTDELMTVIATHTYTGYTAISSWGEITIEDFEGNPRWNSSTKVAYDGNPNNPLQPITGLYITSNATTSETILTYNIDTSKLTGSDFKVTSKIFLEVVTVIGFEFQNSEAVQGQTEIFLDTQNT